MILLTPETGDMPQFWQRINDSGRWEDIGINHCVCFLGDWVFNGNMGRALRFSRDSLDRICDSIQDGAMYNRIAWHKELQLIPRPIKEHSLVHLILDCILPDTIAVPFINHATSRGLRRIDLKSGGMGSLSLPMQHSQTFHTGVH